MKKNNERLIQFFDVDLFGKSTAHDIKTNLASPRTLNQIMAEVRELKLIDLAKQDFNTRLGFEIVLADIEEHSNYWVLLINIVDADAEHVVTKKVGGNDNDREVIEFNQNKGLESSAHLIIFKEQNVAKKHLFLFERVDALRFGRVMKFINHLFRVASKHFKNEYRIAHPSGAKGKMHTIYCRVDFLAHPSDEFKQELASGVINGIKITSSLELIKGFDSKKHNVLSGVQVQAKIGRLDIMKSGGNWKHLQKVIRQAESIDSPFVRVSFTDVSGSGHTATLSTDTGGLVDSDKYVKKCKIEGFGGILRSAYPKIHSGIRDKMLELIK